MENSRTSYQEIVDQRYNGTESGTSFEENVYSVVNPVGQYIDRKVRANIYDVFQVLRQKMCISKAKVLDIGCGKGLTTRMYAEYCGNSENIHGVDLSEKRIELAKSLNPNIKYRLADITKGNPFDYKFDFISMYDVMMHFETEEEIVSVLKVIQDCLTEQGMFLWYEPYQKKRTAAHQGFSKSTMLRIIKKSGYSIELFRPVFKTFLGKYHSAYLTRKLPVFLVRLCEKCVPAAPGNFLFLLKKNSN